MEVYREVVNILTVVIIGAMISSVYALIAVGFTLIYGVRGVLNLAHGALLMIGAYAYLWTTNHIGSTLAMNVVAGIVGVLAAALASYLLYVGLVRHIEQDVIITFLATLVIALILQELVTLGFSPSPRTLTPILDGSVQLAGTRLKTNMLLAFVLSWIALGSLWVFVQKTQIGRSILATAMTEKGAALTGVDISAVNATTWLVAGGFAGFAGVFIGSLQTTSPVMWLDALTLSFIIVTVGGIGSIKGSIVGAYLIGFLETLTVTVFEPRYRGLFALVLLVAIIIVRPKGLFGREFIE